MFSRESRKLPERGFPFQSLMKHDRVDRWYDPTGPLVIGTNPDYLTSMDFDTFIPAKDHALTLRCNDMLLRYFHEPWLRRIEIGDTQNEAIYLGKIVSLSLSYASPPRFWPADGVLVVYHLRMSSFA
jgi:hypothetical protein